MIECPYDIRRRHNRRPISAPLSRWSRWRWPLVIPAFLMAWFTTRWMPFVGIANDNHEPHLIWIGYTLTGFLPVYLPAKLAPSRQLPLAIECAVLAIASTIAVLIFAVFQWRDGITTGYMVALISGYNLATLGGVASAIRFVQRNRAADPERGSTWARATGLILPLAFIAGFVGDAFI